MRILIRTDIGGLYGLGHATRCLALAQALAQHGAVVAFVTQTPALAAFVAPFPCHAHGTVTMMPEDRLILDTLQQEDDTWLHIFRETLGGSVVSLDDPTATPDTCDLLVMPNLHTPPAILTTLHAAFGDKLLAGADYVMLPQEVAEQTPIAYAEREEGPMVFCAGGSDPDGVLKQMWWFMGDALPEVEKVFLVGEHASQHFWLETGARKDMRSFNRYYLREAAMVVTTFGQACYESIFWHTPCLIVGHTDRHCEAGMELAFRHHLTGYIGDMRQMTPLLFQQQLLGYWHLSEDPGRECFWRTSIADACTGVLDGRGIERIAERIRWLSR